MATPVEREGVVLLRERDSALGLGGTGGGEGETWVDELATDEAGSQGLEVGAAPAWQNAIDLLRMCADAGEDAGAGTGLHTVDEA
jgi:hypothetical protein